MKYSRHQSTTFTSKLCVLALLTAYTLTSGAQDTNSSDDNAQQSVRGLVKPLDQAVISGEVAAKITDIPFKNGEAFRKGDTLVKFDCALYKAQLESASAELDAKKRMYNNKKQLLSYNATSDIEVELARAEMRQASAILKAEKIRVERCIIRAPYSGRVIEVLANEYESVDADTKLLSVLNDKALEIELIVPSKWLGWLKIGDKFDFDVDETGKRYSASVSRIGAAVDPVSQTIRLTAVFDSLSEEILSGMSGTASFSGMK